MIVVGRVVCLVVTTEEAEPSKVLLPSAVSLFELVWFIEPSKLASSKHIPTYTHCGYGRPSAESESEKK